MYNNIDLFTQALCIENPWKIDKINFDKDAKQLDIYISHVRGAKFPCKACDDKYGIYDTTKERTWRHINFFQHKAFIHCSIPRVKCEKHGVLQVKVPWSRPRSGFTLLFDAFVMELAACMTVNEIAQLVDEHDTRLQRIINHYVDKARAQEDYSNVENIGIDETSSKKGHNYITLFVDLEESKVLYVTEGKDSTTIDKFCLDYILHQGKADSIKNICCDMSPAFIKGSKVNFPHAAITYDKFHVMKKINEAVDQVRRKERAENDFLKKTRYIWLKNPENLTKKQKGKFAFLSNMNLKTLRAYNLKLALQEFWEIDDVTTAANYLQKWYLWGIRSRLEPMKEAAEFINRNWQGIMQYITSKINNGVLEGINSVIQTVKRKARGFRNIKNFITAIYLRCSKLEFDLPEALAHK